jgi:uncharacterized protein (TIGR01244 family)
MGIFLLLLWLPFVLDGASAAGSDFDELLPGFEKVDDTVYRGAQPKGGFAAHLATRGIKTVLSLREDGSDVAKERAEVEAAGMRFVHIPLDPASRPETGDIRRALDLLGDAKAGPVFVHCRHGRDRTGTVVACYRIERHGWTPTQARAEAERHGMGWWQRGMKALIAEGCGVRP